MTVIERIEQFESKIKELEEKYCENCQEYVCENCWAIVIERGTDERSDKQTGPA